MLQSLGAMLYAKNDSKSSSCTALTGDSGGQAEMWLRLGNDVRGRNVEIALITDTDGIIKSTGGLRSATGLQFNPQHIVTDFYANYPQTG